MKIQITPPPFLMPNSTADNRLSYGLKVSLLVHFTLAVVFTIKALWFPSTPSTYVPSLRVDLVALPEILKKDLIKLKPGPPPAEKKEVKTKAAEPKVDDGMALRKKKDRGRKKRKRKMSDALARIKAVEKLKAQEQTAPKEIRGNIVSKGTSLSADAQETQTSTYYDRVLARVKSNWALPRWLSRQELSAQVRLYIDSRGQLRGMRFVRRSGNEQFDQAVEQAILASKPFPPPDQEVRRDVRADGIILGFPL